MNQKALQAGPVDFLLAALSASCAVYAAGMGVYKPSIALFAVGGVVVGALVGFLLSTMVPSLRTGGSFLYVCAVATAVILAPALNRVLPDGGFPDMLVIAAVLIWMAILGSFFAWSESSLLFQSVPSVALFGMVGAWDTFAGAKWLFYLYIVLTAALLARAQRRLMLRYAKAAGVSSEHRLELGPWRGKAGPLWFAAMAGGVLLTGLVGAPVIQQTVEPVTRNLGVSLPKAVVTPTPTLASSSPLTESSEYRVGKGPVFLSKAELMRLDLDEPGPVYLRAFSYEAFDGNRWSKDLGQVSPMGGFGRWNPISPSARERNPDLGDAAVHLREIRYQFRVTGMLRGSFPAPGALVELQPLLARGQRWRASDISPGTLTFRATALAPDPDFQPTEAPRFLPEDLFRGVYGRSDESTARVRQFARRATQGAKNDYDAALRLERAIGEQALYNTDAPAVPSGENAVDWFLFESKEGYCDLYASAMVVGARSLGMPARYVTGFLAGQEKDSRDENGWLVVRESDAHAWAEVYFDGVGWVPFDPTTYAQVKNGDTSADRQTPAWWRSELGRKLIVGGLAGTALLGLLFGLVARPKPKAAARGPLPDRELSRAVSAFEAALRAAASRPRRPYETLAEYADRARPSLGPVADEARELAAALERLLYAPPESAGDQPRDLAARAHALRRAARQAARPSKVT
ncbi:MAG: DUF3488 and DUF4129 domain-containing transglutaminase family protein [Fimbriimonadaceae bacterium]